ncbi:MAG: FMN-binding protein, partial [Bacillota bacterium]|nr:FMN-binding protein [Bacillota bacterium]
GEALDQNQNVIGYVMNILSLEGYGSDIVVSVGIDVEGRTNGVYILTISETPGLGMNATSPEFIHQFSDKNVERYRSVKAAKSELTGDDQIAAISGATITTNAIVNLVNSAKAVFNVAGGKL